MQILTAFLILGGLGLLFGALLGLASHIFAVQTDEMAGKILECLPGANCGGCGYAGCQNFAKAVSEGTSEYTSCRVCNEEQLQKLAEITGKNAETTAKKHAVVLCSGTSGAAEDKYIYQGISDCNAAMKLGGGQKKCSYACLGFGNCVKECVFGAISIKNGVAVIDPEKCSACGKCVSACPKHVISLVESDTKKLVLCSSREKGASVTKACRNGCIGCGICVKACPTDAIRLENNLAVIDKEKCIDCGECKTKCPRQIIF